jgi:probable DNA repair protein
MSDLSDFPVISKAAVFARLEAGAQATVTVVTPNRRLAQETARAFDATRIAEGLRAWEAADVIPFNAFIERLWEAATYSDRTAATPQLLSPAQEQALWEEVIAASTWGGDLLSPARAAVQAQQAWKLAQAWRIDGALELFPGNDDARAFAEWARAYAKRAGNDLDGARLTDAVGALLVSEVVAKPRTLVLHGFEIVPPQTRDFLRACVSHGIEVAVCRNEHSAGTVTRVTRASATEELETAACWARTRLEQAHARLTAADSNAPVVYPRIGVVVPDLQQRRREVNRVFSRVMAPAWTVPGVEPIALPFNLSLGLPLADYPLVHAALGVLALATGEIDFALASRLLRSPFIGGADSEYTRRVRLDADLRTRLPARVTLARLTAAVTHCPQLRERLEALYKIVQEQPAGARSPHDWGRHFSALLDAVGFPGERALDSNEFQTRTKWYEMLAELARLERVAPRMTAAQALHKLRKLCSDTPFQPEAIDAPVQVLGILESDSMEFDHLWVSGLTDDAWPLAAHPNPFIPVALQKKAGIPEASAESALALDRRITEGWLQAADEVVFSHALREQDRELTPSALIADVPAGDLDLADYPRYREVLHAARALEEIADGAAPAYAKTVVSGGTRVLADQAACPFRAYAHHRLRAKDLEIPADGLDARDRGNLLHALMAEVWGALKTKTRLDSIAAGELAAVIEHAAGTAVAKVRSERPGVLDGRLADLERLRLAKLAREWLEVERARGGFEVVAREERRTLHAAGLEMHGRIDRMDKLADGGHVLIDYKTGRATPKDWLEERPDDPQMPLYALGATEKIAAIAYARVKTGDMKYVGIARDDGVLPKVKAFDSWPGWPELWQKNLDALGGEFAAGIAAVDPKRGLKTCKYCDLQSLCRVHERLAAIEDEDGEFEEGGAE